MTGEQSGRQRIIFVSAIIVFVIVILYYFNILPNQSSKQNNQLTTTPPTKNEFQYNNKKAEALLTKYIRDTIKPEFLPAKIKVEQSLSVNGSFGRSKYLFGSIFPTSQATVSAYFHFKEDSNIPNDLGFFIRSTNTTQIVATASLANSLLTSYFTNPLYVSSCKTEEDKSSCENFQTTNEGKMGYGIGIVYDEEKLLTVIFSCFVPKDSAYYATQASCINR